MSIFREFNINMIPGKPPLIIHVSQYESDFVYTFNLVSGKSTLVIPDTAMAVIRGTKRDGNGYSVEAALDAENHKVVVMGDVQMTACAGKNVFELAIINNDKTICTANFFLDVERAPLDAGTIQSDSVLRELQAIIDSAEISTQAAETAQEAAERAIIAGNAIDYYKTANEPYVLKTSETLGYIGADGSIIDATDVGREVYTDYIPVERNTSMQFFCYCARGTAYVMWGKLALYDAEKTFVRRVDLFYESTIEKTVDWKNTDSDVAYVRLTYRTGVLSADQYVFTYITNLVAKTLSDKIEDLKSDLTIVADATEMLATTTDYVLVLRNDSAYGDNGECLFSVREGESVSGYTRNDGSVVYPMANQGVLPSSNAPKRELTEIIKSYVGVSALQYGNTQTMYDSTCSDQIDCSTFVTAVINRIPYANSRYALGTSASNKVGTFVGDTLLKYSSSRGWVRLLTHQMAQWFAEHKRLFEIPSNSKKACSILQFGDILFSGNGNHDVNYYGIDHCLFVLGTNPDSGVVMVAQGGTAGSPTYYDNESTVCKTSIVYLTSQYIGNNYKVFARPNYGKSEIKSDNTLMRFAMNQVYQFEPFLLTNFYIAAVDGSISYAKTYAGTPDLYEVIPQKTIKYTGPAQSDGVNYTAYCIEYDENKNFVKYKNLTSGDDVLGATTKYVRFSFGHAASLNTNMTLAKLSDFKATMS